MAAPQTAHTRPPVAMPGRMPLEPHDESIKLRPQPRTIPHGKDKAAITSLAHSLRYRGKTIVVKYGGAAMKDPTLKVSVQLQTPSHLSRPACLFKIVPRFSMLPGPSCG